MNVIEIESLFSDTVLFYISSVYERGEFREQDLLTSGYREYLLTSMVQGTRLLELVNRKEFLDAISKIFGQKIVRTYHRTNYQKGVHTGIEWHKDHTSSDRCGVIRVEMSQDTVEGAQFEFRANGNIKRLESSSFGSARMFKCSEEFSHRLLPFKSGVRRSFSIFLIKEDDHD